MTTTTNIKHVPLLEQDLRSDPIVQLKAWVRSAEDAGMKEPEAMIIASATPDGKPSARVVLLKSLDERGLVFYTNYESRKGKELKKNPSVAAVFYWDILLRQVRVEGEVSILAQEESASYFRTRPLESRIGAWASKQSTVVPNRESLDEAFERKKKEFEGREVPLPPFWGGFLLVPRVFEFWQGRENRLHDRIRYSRSGSTWVIERLAP